MANNEDLNIMQIVGKKDFDAYQNYIKLTSYENIVFNSQESGIICDDYISRDLLFPLDLCILKDS
jgi:hypothetical protein